MPPRVRCLRKRPRGLSGELGGTISWEEYLVAHERYLRDNKDKLHFQLLSAERLAELGGFSYEAVTNFLGHPPKTWLPDP